MRIRTKQIREPQRRDRSIVGPAALESGPGEPTSGKRVPNLLFRPLKRAPLGLTSRWKPKPIDPAVLNEIRAKAGYGRRQAADAPPEWAPVEAMLGRCPYRFTFAGAVSPENARELAEAAAKGGLEAPHEGRLLGRAAHGLLARTTELPGASSTSAKFSPLLMNRVWLSSCLA